MKVSKIKDLIKLVEESKITELEISRFGTKIRISKRLEKSSDIKPPVAGLEAQIPPRIEETKIVEKEYPSIKAPMVGTFYRAPAPDADPYIQTGDIVKEGQVVCIIEAMKVMNEIQSEIEGRMIKALAKNETPVEFGQKLFDLEPVS